MSPVKELFLVLEMFIKASMICASLLNLHFHSIVLCAGTENSSQAKTRLETDCVFHGDGKESLEQMRILVSSLLPASLKMRLDIFQNGTVLEMGRNPSNFSVLLYTGSQAR